MGNFFLQRFFLRPFQGVLVFEPVEEVLIIVFDFVEFLKKFILIPDLILIQGLILDSRKGRSTALHHPSTPFKIDATLILNSAQGTVIAR
jgi:hypothetical protein